ncbi:MAG: YebC/PmpR family DNA-binding transcriptional regulator [Planctomycetota bacterium]
MAGHSHWAGIKHKKAAADAKRGKIFSKHAKFIIIAARDGGGDPDGNLGLKYAIERAKADNMPKDNIERAIKRGTGEIEGINFVELVYEGFAPAKVALVADILTDNRNRTASELRKLFEKKGGTLGNPGSVTWMFETKGVLEISQDAIGEDDLMELALEAGAEDVKPEGSVFTVLTQPDDFTEVQTALRGANLEFAVAEIMRLPTNTVRVENAKDAEKVMTFISELDDHDDVQRVSANFDIPDEILEGLDL